MILKSPHTGTVYHTGTYKNKKTASRAKTRHDMVYGASLSAEAYEIETGKKIYILS